MQKKTTTKTCRDKERQADKNIQTGRQSTNGERPSKQITWQDTVRETGGQSTWQKQRKSDRYRTGRQVSQIKPLNETGATIWKEKMHGQTWLGLNDRYLAEPAASGHYCTEPTQLKLQTKWTASYDKTYKCWKLQTTRQLLHWVANMHTFGKPEPQPDCCTRFETKLSCFEVYLKGHIEHLRRL